MINIHLCSQASWDNEINFLDRVENINSSVEDYYKNFKIRFFTCDINVHRLTNNDMFISAYQIYNEKIYDLLQRNKPLQVWKTDVLIIKGLINKKILDTEKLLEMIKRYRCLAKTTENDKSSRSHAIIKIWINNKNYIFIDMAGQENGKTILNHI